MVGGMSYHHPSSRMFWEWMLWHLWHASQFPAKRAPHHAMQSRTDWCSTSVNRESAPARCFCSAAAASDNTSASSRLWWHSSAARLTKKGNASSRPTDITCIASVPGHDCAMTVAGGEYGMPCLGWSLQVWDSVCQIEQTQLVAGNVPIFIGI